MKVGILNRRPNALRFKVVLALTKGPATSRQIAESTGLEFFLCAALLSYLYSRRLVKRKPDRSRVHGMRYIYSL